MKRPRMKILCRTIAGLLLAPVLFFLLLVVLLYVPPVQNRIAQAVAAYASEQTGMDIRLERIRLKFPLDLDLQRFSATMPPDTLVAVEHLLVDLDFSRILKGELGVDAIRLQGGVVDTRDLIAAVTVKGRIGELYVAAALDTLGAQGGGVSLKTQRAMLTGIRLDGCDVDIALRDTTVTDTAQSEPVAWSIGLRNIEVRRTRLAFRTAGDSLVVRGGVKQFVVRDGDVNLRDGIYRVGCFRLEADSVSYDSLVLRDVSLEARRLLVDDTHVQVPYLRLATPYSRLDGEVRLDWAALTPQERGHMAVNLDASVGHQDIAALIGERYPIPGFRLSVEADGNVDSITLNRCQLTAQPLLEARVEGNLTNVMETETVGADLHLDVQTHDLRRLYRLLGIGGSLALPRMHLTGEARLRDRQYTTNLHLQQGQGSVRLKGGYHAASEAYDANIDIRNLNLHAFLPKDSLYALTARAKVSGRGTDMTLRRMWAEADIDIDHLQYGKNNIDRVRLNGYVRKGNGHVSLYSDNEVLRADACADFRLTEDAALPLAVRRKRGVKDEDVSFSLGISHIDLYALGVVDKPFAASMLLQADGSSNLQDIHEMKGSIKAVELKFSEGTFYPSDIDMALLMMPDSINACLASGDLDLQLASREGLQQVLERGNRLYEEAMRQLDAHAIEQDMLKHLLPQLTFRLSSGNKNTMAKIIESMGYNYEQLHIDLNSDPVVGLNGGGYVHQLNTGAVLIDTIQWNVFQDSTGVVRLGGRVRNGPKNKQVVFESNISAELTPGGANVALDFYDAEGRKGVDVGAQFFMEEEGYRLHLHPLNPVIAYRKFTLNADNFISLHHDNRIEAYIDLLADDGTGIKLYSTPNEEALQDITLSVHDFNLGELSAVLPYMPSVSGSLAGDFHLVQNEQNMSVLADANVHKLTYEGAPIGNVGVNAVYLPNPDGTHYVDGIVSLNGSEVMTMAGTYGTEGETIDATAALKRLPLTLANGFVPDGMAELAGYVTGEIGVTGTVGSPVLDGAIATDSMRLTSNMYSLNLRFPDDTIRVEKGNLDFNRIEAYSMGRNPLVLDGTIDLSDLNRIGLNLSVSARNFELINAPKSPRAVAYGKVYVDIESRLTGTLDDMVLRGKLGVLGSTDVTYVLTDSPLTVEDHLSDLVTFADFSDTTTVEVVKTSPQNIDMQMGISMDQAAQVHCLLSADGTNFINLEGGGDLTMTYTTQDGMRMYGRYTIVQGLMNYSLMVVSLKNFVIRDGSFVEFMGDVTNPKLNIVANERVKTTVYENNVPRSVNFDVGLKVSQTLENMGLEFTIEAPGDLTVSNQLAMMSTEERGKVAVTMLATGMYLTESGNGTSGFSATNALNSFLQNQISQISNKALSTIDLNIGIDNTNTASGATQTDYSFSFAKRFWGNRISLIVGGKISSGSEAQNTKQSIIDNVSIEYRLDKSATRYVRLYYDRDTESLLENNVMEMGGGVVFRKKSTRLGELFMFRKEK